MKSKHDRSQRRQRENNSSDSTISGGITLSASSFVDSVSFERSNHSVRLSHSFGKTFKRKIWSGIIYKITDVVQ